MDSFLQKYGPAALITGASSGIGKSFADLLAGRGFDLLLVARREERLQAVRSDLQSRFGVQVHILVQDLTEPGAAGRIYDFAAENNLQIGLLINNAGYGSYGEFDRLNLDSELKMIDLACRAMAELAHRFIPDMKRRGRGGVIFLSSVVSRIATPYMANYSAGKAYEFALANALHGELKPYGIDVLALLPGTTDTEFFDIAQMKRNASFLKRTPRQAAQTALRAIGKRSYVIDGVVYKLFIFIARLIPTRLMIRLAGFVLRPGGNEEL
ncbi:MAG: SDR family oxidoreductase [Candidatus Omnitrophica bacterium]|nr:SDR family oxidoreductase [Candidatus Omnitrophota bacterium]